MTLIKPNQLKNKSATISDAAPSRIIPWGDVVDVGGLDPAGGDLIQITPDFLDREALRNMRIVRLAVSVDSAVLANGDEIVIANQEIVNGKGVVVKAAAARVSVATATAAHASGGYTSGGLESTVVASHPVITKVFPYAPIIALKYNANHTAIEAGKKVRVVMHITNQQKEAPTETAI